MRRWITANATQALWRTAPAIPMPIIDALQWTLNRGGRSLPMLAHVVRENMRAAGVFDEIAFHDYFRHVARHLSNGLRIRRLRRREDVAKLAHEEINLDATVAIIKEIAQSGRGAVLAPAHCCNYLISLARLRQDVPIYIYLRWSRDQRRVAMKREWCEAAGLDVIIEPPNVSNPAARAAVCVDALREGKVLAITPDIAQKASEGIPVRWLNREAYLPTGPASLAMLAEVPIIPLFARYESETQFLYFEEPVQVDLLSRAEGGRPESIRRAMQVWADGFGRFVQNCPQAWFLWGDSRWTKVLRGDAKYSGVVNPSVNEQTTNAQTQETP